MASYKKLEPGALAKKYAGVSFNAQVLAEDFKDRLRIPSRCLWLNYQTGGGLCYGTITEVIGYESTGKTLLAKDFAVVTQQMGGIVLWDDAERAFDMNWAEANGLDLNRIILLSSNEIETFGDWAKDMSIHYRSILTNNEPILLVTDSIAALETLANLENDMTSEKAQMGNRAKAIYNFYRKRNDLLTNLGITTIMINQVRKKVGASLYEASETTPGGDSTKFYASIRIMLHAGKQIKGLMKNDKFIESSDKGIKMGRNVYVEILKNKTAAPRGRVKTEVYFLSDRYGYFGYNRYEWLRELLLEAEIVEQRGSRFYLGEEIICNGKDNFTPMLHSKPKLRKKLVNRLNLNTPMKFKERLESLNKNLYPVKAKASKDEAE